jgi:hypothetical protein
VLGWDFNKVRKRVVIQHYGKLVPDLVPVGYLRLDPKINDKCGLQGRVRGYEGLATTGTPRPRGQLRQRSTPACCKTMYPVTATAPNACGPRVAYLCEGVRRVLGRQAPVHIGPRDEVLRQPRAHLIPAAQKHRRFYKKTSTLFACAAWCASSAYLQWCANSQTAPNG